MFFSEYRYAVARIALFAMLFSVASPTLAATLFAHRADVAARILGLGPVAPGSVHKAIPQDHPAADGDHAAHASPTHEHDAGHESDSEHTAHGIYCSFCLTSSSVVALVGSAPPAVYLHAAARPPAQRVDNLVVCLLPLVLRARGPPPVSRS